MLYKPPPRIWPGGYAFADYGNGAAVYYVPRHRAEGCAGIRGDCAGWTAGVTARLTRRLMSAAITQMLPEKSQGAYAISHTFGRKIEITPEIYQATRHQYLTELNRAGLGVIATNTITEWQKDETAHMHGCVFGVQTGNTFGEFREDLYDERVLHSFRGGFNPCNIHAYHPALPIADKRTAKELRKMFYYSIVRSSHPVAGMLDIWLSLPAVKKSGANIDGQYIYPIYVGQDGFGWFLYCAKHSLKGAKTYQRIRPKSWENNGVRMYTFGGAWKHYQTQRFSINAYQRAEIINLLKVEFVQGENETAEHFDIRRRFFGLSRWTPSHIKQKISEIIGCEFAAVVV